MHIFNHQLILHAYNNNVRRICTCRHKLCYTEMTQFKVERDNEEALFEIRKRAEAAYITMILEDEVKCRKMEAHTRYRILTVVII